MRIIVLSSGSEGNCIYVEEQGTGILIDAGISRRRIVTNLKELGIDPDSVKGVFITHEHYDHTRGLKTLSKHERYPIYASEGTLYKLKRHVPGGDFRQVDFETRVNGMLIKNIPVPHDAAEPKSYIIQGSNARLMVATDLGFVTDKVVEEISNSSAVIFESNHDLEMLNNGPYPRHLKERILSRWGHLSNSQCASALERGMRDGLELVILGHLSKENNHPDLAYEEASKVLKGNVKLAVADRNEITGPFDI